VEIYIFTREQTELNGSSDLEITQEAGFKWTIRVLRQFSQILSKTIDSWETFKDGEIRYFNLPDSEALAQVSWGRYLAAIDKDATELRDLRSSLMHRTELFENMTNSVTKMAKCVPHLISRLTLSRLFNMQLIRRLSLQDVRANSSKL
jgi:hypothetical protein